MSEIIKTEIREDQHGFTGLGNIIYEYDIHLNDIRVTIGNANPFRLNGKDRDRAKNLFLDDDEIKASLERFKQFATNCCQIPLFRLYEKFQKQEVVFARYLVMWYAYRILKMSLKESGFLFTKDHATALYGRNLVDDFYWNNDNIKYLKPNQKRWAINFINGVKEYC